MERWIMDLLEKERKERKIPLEVKSIGKNQYLYKSTTEWDNTKKKRKKVSVYIGKMTQKGIVEKSEKQKYARSIFEYGNAKALYGLSEDIFPNLKNTFPEDYREILAMGIVKMLRQTPIRMIKSAWEKTYLSKEIDACISPNTISEKLRRIGSDWVSQKAFFEKLASKSKVLLFDMSTIFSYSKNLQLAEKGHNADHLYLKQINFVLFFSQDNKIPVMMKSVPGSVRDIKALKSTVREFSLNSCTVVLDRGFASYKTPDWMTEEELKYILPLRRNFEIIDYEMPLKKCFIYNGRGINWGMKKINGKTLYIFEDVKLRAEEETTYISLITEGKRKRKDFEEDKKKFGRIAILSNTGDGGQSVYLAYKQREEIEVAFDAMKNELENDKTHLSDDDAVRGYFFVSFVSLYLYYRLLNVLRKADLIGKVSVNELLFELSKAYLVTYEDGKKRLSEIPKKAEMLAEHFEFELFPKTLRS